MIRVLAAAAIAAPYVVEALRKPVAHRQSNPDEGAMADLSQGRLFYRWHGPQDGPVAVCIHGLTTPSFVWNGLIPHLVEAGFRVLSFDIFGRGASDRPRGFQDKAFFVRMLDDLLRHEQVDGPVTLIGNSMGSAIATVYAAERPEKTRQVVLFVPAGMGHDLGTGAKITQNLPVIGDWLFQIFYPRTLRKGVDAEQGMASTVPGVGVRQLEELKWRGFLRSVLSSLRGVLSESREADHRSLKDKGIPVLALWGAQDDIIPIACKDRLASWNPDAEHIVLESAGHALVYSHTDEVWSQMDPLMKHD